MDRTTDRWAGIDPVDPFGSERSDRATWGEWQQQTQDNIIQARPNNQLTLCLSSSLSHLRLFYSGMCPIFSLLMSWAHLTRKEKIRQRKITREGLRGWLEKKGTVFPLQERGKEEGTAEQQERKDNISKLKSRDEKMWDKMWRFHSSQRDLLMTSRLCERAWSKNNSPADVTVCFLPPRTYVA